MRVKISPLLMIYLFTTVDDVKRTAIMTDSNYLNLWQVGRLREGIYPKIDLIVASEEEDASFLESEVVISMLLIEVGVSKTMLVDGQLDLRPDLTVRIKDDDLLEIIHLDTFLDEKIDRCAFLEIDLHIRICEK